MHTRVNRHSSGSLPLTADRGLSEFDHAVIRLLQQNGRRSYRQMALELGASEKNVRNTVCRLQDSGLIEITAVTFPPLLGYRGMANVAVRVQPSRSLREVAADLAEVEAVDYLAVTTGSYDLFVDVVCRDRSELLRILDEEIRSVRGVASVETFLYLGFPYQGMRGIAPLLAPDRQAHEAVSLTETDREIVANLAEDGRTSYNVIADRLDISEAQVRHRLKRLTETGADRITAIVNPSTLGFDTMAWVGIRAARTRLAEVSRMLAGLVSSTWVATVAGRYEAFAELMCVEEDELVEQLDAIRASELVAEVDSFVYLDLQYKRLTLS
ncbi:MAG: Lrp/AsnC family transcriptional regulator [Solirubrobacterales bacterium]